MLLDDLAPEIQLQIFQFCSLGDLYSLYRVHTSLQGAAESVLYRHIRVKDDPSKLIEFDDGLPKSFKENASPLYTLVNSSQKAVMVKSLHIDLGRIQKYRREITEYDSAGIPLLKFILINLADVLKTMPNLTDLRIISGMLSNEDRGKIAQVIRDGYFKLDTLCLEDGHDFEGIVSSQPNLRLLGVYYSHRNTVRCDVERIFQLLVPRRDTIGPKLFMIDCPTVVRADTVGVTVFPSLHRLGDALQACEEAEQLTRWPDDFHSTDGHPSISLVGISEENLSLFTELMETMATWVQSCHPCLSAPRLRIIVERTSIQNPWQFPEFIQSLALFKNVEKLYFSFPDIPDDRTSESVFTDLRDCLQSNLGDAWPTIRKVIFTGTRLFYVYRWSGWL